MWIARCFLVLATTRKLLARHAHGTY
jgi:hypothetical protein